MLVRAYDDTDPRIQEEVLRRTVPLARKLDSQVEVTHILDIFRLAKVTTVFLVVESQHIFTNLT
jgi:SCY1-like protein 2